jgi:cell division protease FtsH
METLEDKNRIQNRLLKSSGKRGKDSYKKTRQDKNSPHTDKEPEFQWKKAFKTLFLWIFFIVVIFYLTNQLQPSKTDEAVIGYDEYLGFLKQGKIDRGYVIKEDDEFHGFLKEEVTHLDEKNKPKTFSKFKVILPSISDKMLEDWNKYGVKIDFRKASHQWSSILITILPWVVIIAVWLYILRKMQGGGTKGIFSFGKSKAKLLTENRPKVTFDDVAGADEAKQELQEIIDFLKDPGKFQKLGGKIPKGALLLGPPGTGKTLLAKAVAGEAGVPFFSMSGADFVEMFVGVGASRVRDLFDQGKKHAPCIIFIDEIDAVGRHRGAGIGGGHDEREQTLNQLLVEMDGFETNEGVILIAATNRPDVLDNALLRPGRFDRQIVVDRPDVNGREGILKVHTKKIPLDNDVELKVLARGTPGLAGAELANMVNEAALLAARRNRLKVIMQDFEDAKDRVMMGAERKSMLISENEKKQTAYHESGHVLVSKFTPKSDPIHKVTIIPRGRALGITTSLPMDEKHTYSREYCESILAKAMGGRVAEIIVFDELSTGAGNDIELATNLARKMVCEWGMSDKLGPVTFGKKDEEIFLGREIAQHRDYSENTARIIDSEVKGLVLEAHKKAEEIIRKNIDKLHLLAEALLEREILDGEEVNKIINGEKLEPIKREENSSISANSEETEKKVIDKIEEKL